MAPTVGHMDPVVLERADSLFENGHRETPTTASAGALSSSAAPTEPAPLETHGSLVLGPLPDEGPQGGGTDSGSMSTSRSVAADVKQVGRAERFRHQHRTLSFVRRPSSL